MADVVDAATRSRMMAGIRGRDTQPEIAIRRALHALGYRYRLHGKRLPGRPDMVFPGRIAVIFVHGCFWHGHGCHLFKWPSSRPDFWRTKIEGNRKRDIAAVNRLTEGGWRCMTIWECALKGRTRRSLEDVTRRAARWLERGSDNLELRGLEDGGR